MIETLHKINIHLILWQIPVFKNLDPGQSSPIHDEDCKTAVEQKLCVTINDEPYTIPDGNWFCGSMIPDFTNPATVEFWFNKRKHLLDMGVDGFKTDGGEFIYNDKVHFHDNSSGAEMKNAYVSSYVKAYSEFIGSKRVLFSRAGYTGQQNYPCQWAGDQMSTWEEFRHVLTAGLSAGLSGIPYWGFDIGGFAGPLPSVELYERATQFAVFAPIMQWHSEPEGGQFAEIKAMAKGNNDRSPWNMAAVYDDPPLIDRIRFHANLRYNLLPYIYNLAIISSETGNPMMKHLIIEYPEDQNVFDIDDSFMLGDLLVFPIIEALKTQKEIYLPKGIFIDLWNGKRYEGGRNYTIELSGERIPVFVRSGGCLALNLGKDKKLGSWMDNKLDSYNELCFCPLGESGKYRFRDDLGNDITLEWGNSGHRLVRRSGNQDIHIISNITSSFNF
jgi:alpha-D-xyloside xylohydrolase